MEFTFELYENDNGMKMIYVCANDGASGAKYPYEKTEDIGDAIVRYLTTYYLNDEEE